MAAPLIPRMHLFEIDDQPWFPSFLRSLVQKALTMSWTTPLPFTSPPLSNADRVAEVLLAELGPSKLRDFVFIDFCAGAGGPTPSIERRLNAALAAADNQSEPVRFVLTDLHPHPRSWAAIAAASPNVSYEAAGVDAAQVPPELLARYRTPRGKKVFRLFNLAFHHFDDGLAKAILRNTIETSDGFGIFELQSRDLSGLASVVIFGVGILLTGWYHALRWGSPAALFFTYAVPVLPFVLVLDGFVSALRTRTPDEVRHLMATCEPDGGFEAIARWELRSGREPMLPFGLANLNWIVCEKV